MAESLSSDFPDLSGWSSPWSDYRFGVLGVGDTGFALIDTLVELGSSPLALAAEISEQILPILEVLAVQPVISTDPGALQKELLKFAPHILVVSPGIPVDHPVVAAAREAGISVWSDIDFAWRVRDKHEHVSPWVLVSGATHGRRVAELASRLLTAAQIPAFVVGHHSSPLLDALRDPHDYGALLLVATENQVEKLARGEGPRSPVVAVCVDDTYPVGHGALYDGVSLACVYRKGAGNTMGLVEDAEVIEGARAIGVGFDSPDKSDLGLVEGIIVDRAFLEDRANHALEVSTLDELAEAGWTIPEDLPVVVGAVAVARAFDVPPAVIAGVLTLP